MRRSSLRPRVCHFTSVHEYNDDRIFLKQCRALAAAGFDTHLIAPGAPTGKQDGVQIHSIRQQPMRRLLRMTTTAWAVYHKALSLQANIYHFHDPELIPVGLLLRARGRRVIYDVHEDVPRQILWKPYLPQATRRPIGWLVERLEEHAGSRFSALVVATPTIGARFRAINPRTVVLNNYPLRDELHAVEAAPWHMRGTAVAYVGGISTQRGIMELVAAMEQVAGDRRATLELAGSFFSVAEREQVMRLNGWSAVHELGMLPRSDVARLLNQVQAGLVTYHPTPAYIVSQPIKLFEYMSAGLPVIASNFPLWNEFVEQPGCGLLVDPMQPRAIANAIEFVLANPDVAETMGRRGREAVESCYNWEAEVPKLVQLYDELLASGM